VLFPSEDGMRAMPFSELLPLAFEMKLKTMPESQE
jgi:hypothetical protein